MTWLASNATGGERGAIASGSTPGCSEIDDGRGPCAGAAAWAGTATGATTLSGSGFGEVFASFGGSGGAAAAAGFAAGASPPAASISATTMPSLIESPTLTLSASTTPANGAGTSIVALLDSSVTRPWSFLTVSPTATSTSMTGTSG